MKKLILLSVILFFGYIQVKALEIPGLLGRINDHAQILTSEQQTELDLILAGFEQQCGAQFVLLTLPSLEEEILEDYTVRVSQAWKLGQKDQDNGLLLFVAQAEKKIRIEVGYGLESVLPDGRCGTLIRKIIVPAFRRQDYYSGISEAFRIMATTIAGDSLTLRQLQQSEEENSPGLGFGIALIVILVITSFSFLIGKGGTTGRHSGGWSSGLGSGWSSGGGGGGFSGGGGSFGGGGASGGW
jgi:uncharacterized protein